MHQVVGAHLVVLIVCVLVLPQWWYVINLYGVDSLVISDL